MFSATGGRYSQFGVQDQCPLASVHKILIFAFQYEIVCTPFRHAQTLGTFSSDFWKLSLL
jgi:hypothetical protein